MPTPAVAMLTKSMRADLGVMISASHNLFEDNGIKLFGPQGFKLSDDVEKQIEQLLDEPIDRRWRRAPASAAPAASTASMTATSNSPSARCRASSRSTACAW
jgi:phosphomannomutase